MLCRIVDDIGAQISRRPRPQRRRKKNKPRTRRDHYSGEHQGRRTISNKRRRDQVSQLDDKTGVIDIKNQKRTRINAGDDPEPLFKLELRRPHVSTLASAACWRKLLECPALA